jgi:hypothetical protein
MGMGAGLSVSQVVGDVSSRIKDTPDLVLQKSALNYRNLREAGFTETQAKDDLIQYVMGDGRVAIAALVGAIGGAGGIAGQVARGATGTGGRLANAGINAVEGAVGMGVYAGGVDLDEQQALTQAGVQPNVDAYAWAVDTLGQMGLGALLGAAHGLITRPESTRKPVPGQSNAVGSERSYPKPDELAPDTGTSSRAAPPKTTPDATDTSAPPTPSPVDPAIAAALAPKDQTPTPASKAPSAPTPATDTAVPEANATLKAQQQELVDGKRPVMIYKGGEGVLPKPAGMRQTKLGDDIIQYNPELIGLPAIKKAVKDDTLGGLLGLGPVTKNDATARIAAGETPVAVTERAPDGTELKAAAGTTETAPVQTQVLEAGKAPDSTVQVEDPAKVVADRVAAQTPPGTKGPEDELVPNAPPVAGALAQTFSPTESAASRAPAPGSSPAPIGRVLEDVSPQGRAARESGIAEAQAQVAARLKAAEPPPPPAAGHRTIPEKAKRASDNLAADKIMAELPPAPSEARAVNPTVKGGIGARTALLNRAKAMLERAKEAGVKISGGLRDNNDEAREHSTGAVLLAEARDLMRSIAKKPELETEHIAKFMKREFDLRAGYKKEVLAERRAEGDARKKQTASDAIDKMSVPDWGKSANPENYDAIEHSGAVANKEASFGEGDAIRGDKVTADSLAGMGGDSEHEGAVVNLGDEAAQGEDVEPPMQGEGRERPAPKIEGDTFVAGKQATGFKVEAKKTRGQAIKDKIAAARKATNTEPTEAQKLAGNYAKGKVTLDGLPISIENPKGSIRTGTIAPESKPAPGSDASWRTMERYNQVRDAVRPSGKPQPGDILWGHNNQPVPHDKALALVKDAIENGGVKPWPYQISEHLGIRQIDAQRMIDELGLGDRAERVGVTPKGKTWASEMPGDYGYIRGTKGADGDHVDVLVGPKGETGTGYVINQHDPKTGAFDEHKVILGVKSPEEATALYDKQFSDGSGPSRRESIVAMPRAQLVEFLDDHTATRAPLPEVPGTVTAWDGKKFSPIETSRVGDILDTKYLPPTNRTSSRLLPFLTRKLNALVGDVPVHWVDQDTIHELHPPSLPGQRVYGFYDSAMRHIVMNAEVPESGRMHTVMHEAVHAAISDALERDTVTTLQLQGLMRELLTARPDVAGMYAMTDEHEFLAEMLSNPELQAIANKTPISQELAEQFGIKEFRRASLWSGVVAMARMAIGLPPHFSNVLEAALATAERLSWSKDPLSGMQYADRLNRATRPLRASMSEDDNAVTRPRQEAGARHAALTLASKGVQKIMASAPTQEGFIEKGVKFLANDQMRQMWEKHFGPVDETNPMRKVTDAIEKMGMRMRAYLQPANDLAKALYVARRQYEGAKGWYTFIKLLRDSAAYNLHPDQALDSKANSHLRLAQGVKDESEGAMHNWAARAKHPELAALYESLPQDLKDLWAQLRDYYKNEHEERSQAILEAVLKGHDAPKGSTVDDVVQRALDGKLTEEDSNHYEALGIGKALKDATEFQKQQGFYAPMKRFGDYVVTGEHELNVPANAKQIGKDTVEFGTREEAHKYAASQDLPTSSKIVHYDPLTGERVALKDAISTAGSPVAKYQVRVERSHVEFADTPREIKAIRQAMIDSGLKNVSGIDKRRLNPDVDYSLSSPQVKTLIDAVNRRKDLSDPAKALLAKSLAEASITMRAGNRLEPHYLKRRNVAGASDDIIRTLTSYSRASAAARSRADFNDVIDTNMSKMKDKIEANRLDGLTFTRRTAHQELESRIYGFGSPEYSGRLAPFWQKVMAVSFWKRMMSPAHLLLHLTHPGMISGPVLGARHGFGQAYRELYRSYRDMGGVSPALAKGVAGMAQVFKNDTSPTNFLGYFKSKLADVKDSSGVLAMIKDLEATGHIHPDAGFEVGHFGENATRVQAGMERVDRAFRELTSATESINRVAEAVAAYRLELRKNGGNHQAAVRYAKDTLANTQGLYSATNAAPIFRNQSLRPFLQFKQFPQMIYHLLGRNLYQAFKGDTPEVRAQAARSFAGVVATHAAMAGVLGLPTELIKAPVMLANALGVTNTNWDDLENKAQQEMSALVGPQMGEIVMHGLSRALGPLSVDVHHRLGLGSLLTFGEPSSNKPQDTLNYMLDTVAGAPGSMLTDTLDASQSAMHGDWEGAFEKATPVKALADLLKAARLGVYGKPTRSDKPGMAPVGPAEITTQALGFNPANAAQYNAARWASEKAAKNLSQERATLIQGWVGATGAAKAKAMQAISAFNAGVPADQRISSGTLQNAGKPATYELGQRVTNRSKRLLDEYKSMYNVQ